MLVDLKAWPLAPNLPTVLHLKIRSELHNFHICVQLQVAHWCSQCNLLQDRALKAIFKQFVSSAQLSLLTISEVCRGHTWARATVWSPLKSSERTPHAHPKACALFIFKVWLHHEVHIKTLTHQSLISFCAHCIPMKPTLGRRKTYVFHHWRMREREQREQKLGQGRNKEHHLQAGPGWRRIRSPEGGEKADWNHQQLLTTTSTLSRMKDSRDQVKKKRTRQRALGNALILYQEAKEGFSWAWC